MTDANKRNTNVIQSITGNSLHLKITVFFIFNCSYLLTVVNCSLPKLMSF